jgi:hypothetical protein
MSAGSKWHREMTCLWASRCLRHRRHRDTVERGCRCDAPERRHECDMVSQEGTREGERIRKALLKGPPTDHDTVPRRDATEDKRSRK